LSAARELSPLELADAALCAWDDAFPHGNPRRAFQVMREAIDLPAVFPPAGVERAGPAAFLQPAASSGTSLAPRPAQSLDTICPYCVLEGSFGRGQVDEARAGLRSVASCARHS